MKDLIIRDGRIIDPKNNFWQTADILIENGKIVEIGDGLSARGSAELNARGKLVVPGIIDMHTHMRTLFGHPQAQRMVALAGVCTALDLAGPLDNILESIDKSGAGINIGILEAASQQINLSTNRPDKTERKSFIEKSLEKGALGIKLLGGHFPMDVDISQAFIEECSELNAWIAWHVGNTVHGSNTKGLRDAVGAAGNHFLHVAHVNSYCRAQVSDEVSEALEAIELLKSHPNLFSESYLSELNGTRLTIENDTPVSKVTITCLHKKGYEATYAGMKKCILDGAVGVLRDNGVIGELICGKEGVEHWESMGTKVAGSFAVNPAASRFLLATAKRADGSFVIDSFSTDGGCYPRNVIVENGLLLVKFGALTLNEFVMKSSLNAANALGLPNKGHLGTGADADISILDFEKEKAYATVVGGNVIMEDGKLLGKGTSIICDERGSEYLTKRNIPFSIVEKLSLARIENRFKSKK